MVKAFNLLFKGAKMIKIIDVNTGERLIPGHEFDNITGHVKVIDVSNNLFNPWAEVEINGEFRLIKKTLMYRFLHPEFLFQPMFFWNT